MYNYLIYIPPFVSINLEELKDNLKIFFDNKKVKPSLILEENRIILKFEDYHFYIAQNADKYVNEELLELLQLHKTDFAGNLINQEEIKHSKTRLELYGDDDFEMKYFNESLFIIEFFEKYDQFVIFQVN